MGVPRLEARARDVPALEVEQRCLRLEAARETTQPAVAADDAVAGKDDREWVAPVRRADGARGGGIALVSRPARRRCASRHRESRRVPARPRAGRKCRAGRAGARTRSASPAKYASSCRAVSARTVAVLGRRGMPPMPARDGSSPGQRTARTPCVEPTIVSGPTGLSRICEPSWAVGVVVMRCETHRCPPA